LSSVAWLLIGTVLCVVGFWRQRLYVIPILFIAGGLIRLWRGDIMQYQLAAPHEKLAGHQLTNENKAIKQMTYNKIHT
jgi:hypothetical protein